MIYAHWESDDEYLPEDQAPDWMINSIHEKMMYARLPDHKTDEIRIRLSGNITVEDANKIITVIGQYIDIEFRSATFINKRVKRMVNDESK